MTTKMLSSRLVVSYKYIVSNMLSNSGFVDKKNNVAFKKIIAKVDCSIKWSINKKKTLFPCFEM